MRIPFFGRKPEPWTEGQIEYLRRYNVFGETLARGYNGPGPQRPLPDTRVSAKPCPPRQGEFDQQWDDYTVAFWQRKPLDAVACTRPNARPDRLGGWRTQQRASVRSRRRYRR